MMNECIVSLASRTEDGVSEERVRGTFQTVSDGFQVFYLQDGDDVSVLISNRSLLMKRRGSVSLDGYFTQDGASYVKLFLGDRCGEIPAALRRYVFERGKNGFTARLSYALGSGQDEKEIDLNINIEYLEEK